MTHITKRELMIYAVARLLKGSKHVAVGAASPIPAAGAMLLRALEEETGGDKVRVSILGSVKHNFFTNGSAELFDCAAQGRIDAFFLSGGQIDGKGNVNLVGVGDYPSTKVRWPGSFGSSFLYFMVPKIILFREEHTPRIFVEDVDFISAPGTSDASVVRKGGPIALLTGMGLFDFDKQCARFTLNSIHSGFDLEDIKAATGFEFDHEAAPKSTELPDNTTLGLLRGRVLNELSETYPDFAYQLKTEIFALEETVNG
jgi:glutaconate CoA-transferase subunit B